MAEGTGGAPSVVVFLDVDGVLHGAHERHRPFRPHCIEHLRAIVQQSGASIVLSSNWRLTEWGTKQIDAKLQQAGLAALHGCTHPVEDHFNTRADEILDFLHRSPGIQHFVILDDVALNYDDEDAPVPPSLMARLVKTDEDRGLREPDVEAALACLATAVDRSTLPPARLFGETSADGAAGPLEVAEQTSEDPACDLSVGATPEQDVALDDPPSPPAKPQPKEGEPMLSALLGGKSAAAVPESVTSPTSVTACLVPADTPAWPVEAAPPMERVLEGEGSWQSSFVAAQPGALRQCEPSTSRGELSLECGAPAPPATAVAKAKSRRHTSDGLVLQSIM